MKTNPKIFHMDSSHFRKESLQTIFAMQSLSHEKYKIVKLG